MLRPPRLPALHPDLIIEFEKELEAHVVALMDRARDAGWHQEQTMRAVVSLARNYVQRLDANLETDTQIAKAMRNDASLQ